MLSHFFGNRQILLRQGVAAGAAGGRQKSTPSTLMAPGRSRQSLPSRRPMTVEHRPPGVSPPSRMKSTAEPKETETSEADRAGGWSERLALVAVTALPKILAQSQGLGAGRYPHADGSRSAGKPGGKMRLGRKDQGERSGPVFFDKRQVDIGNSCDQAVKQGNIVDQEQQWFAGRPVLDLEQALQRCFIVRDPLPGRSRSRWGRPRSRPA